LPCDGEVNQQILSGKCADAGKAKMLINKAGAWTLTDKDKKFLKENLNNSCKTENLLYLCTPKREMAA